MTHNKRSRCNWSRFAFLRTRARAIVTRVVPLFLLFHPHVADAVPPSSPPGKRWVLVWSDDFNGTTLDASKWNHRSEEFRAERRHRGHRIRWRYEHDNVSLRDSYLVLRNTRDPQLIDGAYLVKAAAIDSKEKFEQTYGYFEASIRIAPAADGVHTAFWLQNDNRYRTAADGGVDGPSDGAEIDILESVYTSDRYHMAVHWEGNSLVANAEFAPMHDGQFHVFAVAWTPQSYTFYADGQHKAQRYRDIRSRAISHSDGYVILSTGVNWYGGNAGAGAFPNEALVDWVRVYELQDIPQEIPVVEETTAVLEPPDPRGTRDIGRITLVSSQPGTIQGSWEAPSEAPANYRISWAKEGEDFKTWTDRSGNAYPTATSQTITGLEEGEEYKVKVRASYSGTAGDWSGQVIITAAVRSANEAPIADAGSDQTVEEGSVVTLSGTAYDPDDDNLTYQWTHDQDDLDISLDDPTALSTTFTAPEVDSDATIIFTLTATDEYGATGSDAVAITVQDVPASLPQENTVVLEPPDPRGTRDIGRITLVSSQPGKIQGSWEAPSEAPANYRISWAKEGEDFKTWTDRSGNAFPTEPSYTITGLEEGEEYKVKVRASYSGTAGDWSGEVIITVAASSADEAPTADAGSDQTVEEGSVVTLSGTASDPDDDNLTYQWTHDRDDLGISLDDPTALSTTFTAPEVDSDATIIFTLTATDEHGATGSDAVAITVQDVPASSPQGNTVVLEPPDPRGTRDIGGITLVSSQPGKIQGSWEAPTEEPDDYRISWAKEGEDFKTWTDNTGNAFPTEPSYTITGLDGGEKYKVKVRARYGSSPGAWSGEAVITVIESPASKPVVPSLTFGLGANYPNPFNPETQIAYTLSETGPVELAIYNVLGQRIRTLVQEVQAAGRYQVVWNGRNENGGSVASGIYLYRLSSAQGVQVRRLLLLK